MQSQFIIVKQVVTHITMMAWPDEYGTIPIHMLRIMHISLTMNHIPKIMAPSGDTMCLSFPERSQYHNMEFFSRKTLSFMLKVLTSSIVIRFSSPLEYILDNFDLNPGVAINSGVT